MSKNVTVEIPEGYTTHKGVSHQIVFRPPTIDDYMDLGELYDVLPGPDDRMVPIENIAKVKAYMARLMVEPTDQILVGDLGITAARAVRLAVRSFFQFPDAEPARSSNSGENSSEPGSSPQTTLSE